MQGISNYVFGALSVPVQADVDKVAVVCNSPSSVEGIVYFSSLDCLDLPQTVFCVATSENNSDWRVTQSMTEHTEW